jgi:hypothetical protein
LLEAKANPLPNPVWADEWKEVEDGSLAVAIEDPNHGHAVSIGRYLRALSEITPEEKGFLEVERQVFQKASRIVLGVDLRDGLHARIRLTCNSPEDADELQKTCVRLLMLLRRTMDRLPSPSQVESPEEKALIQLGKALVATMAVKRADNQVLVTAESTISGLRALPALVRLLIHNASPLH